MLIFCEILTFLKKILKSTHDLFSLWKDLLKKFEVILGFSIIFVARLDVGRAERSKAPNTKQAFTYER